MQDKSINPDSMSVEELKVVAYDLNLEKSILQGRVNDMNKNLNYLDAVINERIKASKNEVVAEKEDKKK